MVRAGFNPEHPQTTASNTEGQTKSQRTTTTNKQINNRYLSQSKIRPAFSSEASFLNKHQHLKLKPQWVTTYAMSSVEKFTTVEMKLSLMITPRIARQSVAFSPSNRQIDSKASLTAGGGLPIERTSTRCCFLMDCTAGEQNQGQS